MAIFNSYGTNYQRIYVVFTYFQKKTLFFGIESNQHSFVDFSRLVRCSVKHIWGCDKWWLVDMDVLTDDTSYPMFMEGRPKKHQRVSQSWSLWRFLRSLLDILIVDTSFWECCFFVVLGPKRNLRKPAVRLCCSCVLTK